MSEVVSPNAFTFIFDTDMPFEVIIDGKKYRTDKKKIMEFIKTFITEEITDG